MCEIEVMIVSKSLKYDYKMKEEDHHVVSSSRYAAKLWVLWKVWLATLKLEDQLLYIGSNTAGSSIKIHAPTKSGRDASP